MHFKIRVAVLAVVVLAFFADSAEADWWDSFTDSVSSGLSNAASWVKETASPAVRGKFDEYKQKLQDPETHKNIREWVAEKADTVSEFTQEEIVPELKKIYDAATADSAEKKEASEKSQD